MRFLTASLVAMAAVVTPAVHAMRFQLDISGDNNFEVFVSRASAPSSATKISQSIHTNWQVPQRFTDLQLDAGDVLSVYVHNDVSSDTSVTSNPSAIVARLRETNTDLSIKTGGLDILTNHLWQCAYRHETLNAFTAYNSSRLTGAATNWAYRSTSLNTVWPTFQGQDGSTKFEDARQLAPLGVNTPTNIWRTVGDANVVAGLGLSGATPLAQTPYWIYGNDQQTGSPLAHHGWCRLSVPSSGNSGINGDPIFSGFQGQTFQFHGLPDEHFNLISAPTVQLNAHFVYLASGKCDAKATTACFSHAGTYMDTLGFTIGETRIKLAAGAYDAGLRVWVDDLEIHRGKRNSSLSDYTQASLIYHRNGHVEIHTELIQFKVANSDNFMNIHASLSSAELLQIGNKKHTITDSSICKVNDETNNYQQVEAAVAKKYEITTALHGLIGQTWRNVKVCGRDWMGTVQDYIVPSLFSTEYHYSYFRY